MDIMNLQSTQIREALRKCVDCPILVGESSWVGPKKVLWIYVPDTDQTDFSKLASYLTETDFGVDVWISANAHLKDIFRAIDYALATSTKKIVRPVSNTIIEISPAPVVDLMFQRALIRSGIDSGT